MTMLEQPDECESCGYETTALKSYGDRRLNAEINHKVWLCWVCACTEAGNAFLFPEQHRHDRSVIKTIAWGINYLRDSMKELEPEPESTIDP